MLMSTIITTDTVADVIAEVEHNAIVSAQEALDTFIEASAVASTAGEGLDGALAGYEAQFVAMVEAFSTARQAGATESEVRKALQADQKASGTRHFAASADGCSALDLLAKFSRLNGDLPEGAVRWVMRPATNGATGLLEGEASVAALIRQVRAPGARAEIKAAGHADAFGKAVVERLLTEASTKADAIAALQAQARHLDKIVRDAKSAAAPAKTADRLLKAASGPIGKVAEALDAGLVEDKDAVLSLIESLTAALAAAKAHTALV